MTPPTNSELECLVIPIEILKLKVSDTTKIVLSYIFFRMKLEGKVWTFSQADIVKHLHIPQSKVSRILNALITAGVLTKLPRMGKVGYVPLKLNREKLLEYLKRISIMDIHSTTFDMHIEH